MYYRYEAMNENGEYEGIFSFFDPSQRRYFNRFLKEPKWYKNNPNVESKCWFTEEDYKKYHHIIDELIIESGLSNIKLIKCETLCQLVMKGKMQCITLMGVVNE